MLSFKSHKIHARTCSYKQSKIFPQLGWPLRFLLNDMNFDVSDCSWREARSRSVPIPGFPSALLHLRRLRGAFNKSRLLPVLPGIFGHCCGTCSVPMETLAVPRPPPLQSRMT